MGSASPGTGLSRFLCATIKRAQADLLEQPTVQFENRQLSLISKSYTDTHTHAPQILESFRDVSVFQKRTVRDYMEPNQSGEKAGTWSICLGPDWVVSCSEDRQTTC